MDKDLLRLLEESDGQFNEELNAYVSAYPVSDDELAIEFEYVDKDNDEEVIEVKRYSLTVNEA